MEKDGYIVDNFLLITGSQVYQQQEDETEETEEETESK